MNIRPFSRQKPCVYIYIWLLGKLDECVKKGGEQTKRDKRYRRTRSKHIRKGRKSRRLRGGVITRNAAEEKIQERR